MVNDLPKGRGAAAAGLVERRHKTTHLPAFEGFLLYFLNIFKID
jgi:hypothetical protein